MKKKKKIANINFREPTKRKFWLSWKKNHVRISQKRISVFINVRELTQNPLNSWNFLVAKVSDLKVLFKRSMIVPIRIISLLSLTTHTRLLFNKQSVWFGTICPQQFWMATLLTLTILSDSSLLIKKYLFYKTWLSSCGSQSGWMEFWSFMGLSQIRWSKYRHLNPFLDLQPHLNYQVK